MHFPQPIGCEDINRIVKKTAKKGMYDRIYIPIGTNRPSFLLYIPIYIINLRNPFKRSLKPVCHNQVI